MNEHGHMRALKFDLERARKDTPGCESVLHFNNAGAALMPQQVVTAMIDHLQLEARIGGYEAAEQSRDKVENTYRAIASLINCDREEVAIVENATRAWDMAFYSIQFKAGDRILTSIAEYASNYIAYLQVARKTGAVVEAIPNDEYGQLDVQALRDMIDDRVKLIAITHVPTNGGLVNPAAQVGKIAREAGVLYLLDACQSVGQMPIDVAEIGCHMLSATGRKYLRGPRGTGFLYVARETLQRMEPPFLDLHAAELVSKDRFVIRDDARRFENWEIFYAGKIGLGVAIDYALAWGVDVTWARILHLAEGLRARLSEMPGVTVYDLGSERCGIVTFTIDGHDPEDIKSKLSEQSVNVSVSLPEDTLLDTNERALDKIVRASVHYYNSEEEVERFCDLLISDSVRM